MSSLGETVLDSRNDYSIGWIAALPIEYAAAKAMLDERHGLPADYEQPDTDKNSYTCGRLGKHNVVIACLASGVYGTTSATATALPMLFSFPNVKFGLLVGIGAGIPSKKNDIRLGDVAVSQHNDSSGGVFQYDFGKANADGQFTRKDFSVRPPEVLLKALSNLKSDHELDDTKIPMILKKAAELIPKWGKNYAYPEAANDYLFQSSYMHADSESDCAGCDPSKLIKRLPRESSHPEIHYGIIASGNTLVKDAAFRDQIVNRESACICLEMEAAGLVNNFPSLVIRGICDYADSHKNDAWQKYAAAVAAAYAKELLSYIHEGEVVRTAKAKGLIHDSTATMAQIEKHLQQTNIDKAGERKATLLKALYESTCDYSSRKNRNDIRVPGTCEWFINHKIFKTWQEGLDSSLLWVSADPGCGKSVLSRYLIDEIFPATVSPSVTVCYFFFKDIEDQRTAAGALCALLHQLFQQRPHTLTNSILDDYHSRGMAFTHSVSLLWSTLLKATANEKEEVICMLDALDECQERDRRELVALLNKFGIQPSSSHNLKFIVTSRPYSDISLGFREAETRVPTIHLKGDDEKEIDQIAKEINLVIKHRINKISDDLSLQPQEKALLFDRLTSIPNRTYLWAQLVLDDITESIHLGKERMHNILSRLPPTVDDVYEKMLVRVIDQRLARRLFSIVLASNRPLTVRETTILLHISNEEGSYDDFNTHLQAEDRMRTTIRELSGLLITIIDSKVYLIHQTAKEFLVKQLPQKSPMFIPRKPVRATSISTYASGLLSPNSQATASLTTLASSTITDEISLTWKHSMELSSCHANLAELCALTLRLEPSNLRFPELDSYCRTSLFAHLYMAGSSVTTTQAIDAVDLLNTRLRLYWNLILRHMPNYEKDSIRYCPSADDQILNLLLYLSIYPLVKVQLSNPSGNQKGVYPCLCIAAARGDIRIVSLLVHDGYKINSTLKDEISPLHAAAECGRDEIVKHLLKKDAKLEATASDGRRPLHYAVGHKHLSTINLLLDYGANLEAGQIRTPLELAVIGGDIPIVQLLLRRGAKIPETNGSGGLNLLALALPNSPINMIKFLLETCGHATSARNNTTATPLYFAVYYRRADVVEMLVAHSADIEAINSPSRIPSNLAIQTRNPEAVEILYTNQSKCTLDIMELALRPRSQAHNLDWSGNIDRKIVDLLLDVSASLSQSDLHQILCHQEVILDLHCLTRFLDLGAVADLAALCAALRRRKKYQQYEQFRGVDEGVIELIAEKLDIASSSPEDRKKTTSATLDLDIPDTALFLLNEGIISITELDRHERTKVLIYAAMEGDLQHTSVLLDALVGIDERDTKGRTALSYALCFGMRYETPPALPSDVRDRYDEIAKLLLSRGAAADLVDNKGMSPLDWAELAGNTTAKQLVDQHSVIPSPGFVPPQFALPPEEETLRSITVPPVSRTNTVPVAGPVSRTNTVPIGKPVEGESVKDKKWWQLPKRTKTDEPQPSRPKPKPKPKPKNTSVNLTNGLTLF